MERSLHCNILIDMIHQPIHHIEAMHIILESPWNHWRDQSSHVDMIAFFTLDLVPSM